MWLRVNIRNSGIWPPGSHQNIFRKPRVENCKWAYKLEFLLDRNLCFFLSRIHARRTVELLGLNVAKSPKVNWCHWGSQVCISSETATRWYPRICWTTCGCGCFLKTLIVTNQSRYPEAVFHPVHTPNVVTYFWKSFSTLRWPRQNLKITNLQASSAPRYTSSRSFTTPLAWVTGVLLFSL